MFTPSESQVAYVPVPFQFLPSVTELLSKLMQDSVAEVKMTEVVHATDPDVTDSRDAFWTEEHLEKLLPLLKPQNTVSLAVLDMAASNPGALVSFPDACAKVGLDVAQGRAHIGALRKVCSKVGSREFPVTEHWAEGGENIKYYRISLNIAARWLKVRNANP